MRIAICITIRQTWIYRAQRKRKHERSEYLLFLARYRQNHKCEARQTRSGWILEVEELDKFEFSVS